MKDFINVMWRYVKPYKHLVALNFVYNLLSALFAVFSIALMIPMLRIILMQDQQVYELMPMAMDMKTLENNLYYYMSLYKDSYGSLYVLLFVGVFLIIGTLFKTVTSFAPSYTRL